MKRKVCFEENLRFRSSSYFQVQRCMGTTISIRPLKLIASLNERLDVYCLQRTFTITKCVLSKNVVTDQKVHGKHCTERCIYISSFHIYFFIYLSFLISTSSLFDKRGMEATKTHIKFPLMLCLSVQRKTCFDNIIIIKFETKNTHIGKKAFYIRLKEDEIMMIFSSPG